MKLDLIRGLSFTPATSIVIGVILGSGVYLKSAVIAQQVGTPWMVLAVWLAGGLLTLAGALTYAELGAMLPRAGGEFVFLRSAYGDAPAFFYGWMRFIIGGGGIAALGTGAATFLFTMLPVSAIWAERDVELLGQQIHWQFGLRQVFAVGAILFFSALNCAGVAFGGRVQFILTAAKVLGAAAITVGVFLFSRGATWDHMAHSIAAPGGMHAFGAAMIAVLWAYNGWNYLPMVAGEIKDPGRNVPRALMAGVLIVLAVYGSINVAYFYALPIEEVATSNSAAYPNAPPVGAKAAQTFLGPVAAAMVSLIFFVSTIGALNGVVLSTARIPFAMAREGLFFERFGEISSRRVPVWAMGMQAIWASVLALSGSFDQLTNLAMFAYCLFYALTASSVFVLRRTMPDTPRPYRVWGYPVVPAAFVVVAAWVALNSVWANPVEAATASTLIVAGLPLYLHYRRRRRVATLALEVAG